MNPHTEEYAAWLAGLKQGDAVAMSRSSWAGRAYDLMKIERLTATQFVLPRGMRVRRDDGLMVGGSYRRIVPVTDDVRDAMDFANLKDWLSGLTMNNRTPLSLNVLRAMKKAHDEEIAKC